MNSSAQTYLLNITNGTSPFVYRADTGNVGIGTLTPGATLEVVNGSAVDALFNVTDGSDTRFVIDSVGNVGIGTTSPNAPLTVVGDVNITGDVYTHEWTNYYSSSMIVGWSVMTDGRKYINYKKIGKTVFVAFHLEGTSDSTSITFTLPYTSSSSFFQHYGTALTFTYDNTVAVTTPGRAILPLNSATVTCYKDMSTGAWTASGSKIVNGQFWYEVA